MQPVWLFVFASLLASVIYMIRAYRKSMRQNKLIVRQSAEIQKQNRELEHRNKLLQEFNTERQQIIGVVSHDLKGPFNRIFALIQLMSMSAENLNSDQKEYLGKIHQIVVDGLGMVRNLVDNRKLEDRGIDMRLEMLNFSAILSSLVKQYQSLAEKKNIHIHYQARAGFRVIVTVVSGADASGTIVRLDSFDIDARYFASSLITEERNPRATSPPLSRSETDDATIATSTPPPPSMEWLISMSKIFTPSSLASVAISAMKPGRSGIGIRNSTSSVGGGAPTGRFSRATRARSSF